MDLVLIGGVSGSGKSVALAALEDSGYDAVNNLPLPMLGATIACLAGRGETRIAVSLDVRSAPGLPGLDEAVAALRGQGWTVRFVFLDATVETLVRRFSETRRRHPFSDERRTLAEAIDFERALLSDARLSGTVFDTSELSSATLRNWVKDFLSVDATRLALLFESFGYKRGIPLDADLVFDVRCLPNPHYEPLLQPLTGKDAPVVEFLERIPEVERMYADIYHFVGGWLPDYARDNRAYLTVAIGCTGGQHRSVYLVERLAQAFAPRFQVQVRHRELRLMLRSRHDDPPRRLASLAVFPLRTVLFPGGLLPIKVFEQRYIDMATRCLKHEAPFGVCLLTQGEEVAPPGTVQGFAPIGTLARITRFDMPQLGILHVLVQGASRFRVERHGVQKDNLAVAEAVAIADEPSLPLPAAFEPLARLLELIATRIGADNFPADTRYDDSSWVGYRLAELLPLPLPIKQTMLEVNDPGVRLKVLSDFCAQQGLLGA